MFVTINFENAGPFTSTLTAEVTSETEKAFQLDNAIWVPKSGLTRKEHSITGSEYFELKPWFRRKMSRAQWDWVNKTRDVVSVASAPIAEIPGRYNDHGCELDPYGPPC